MDIENLMTAKIPPRTAFMTTLPTAATHSYGCFSHNSESLAPLIQSKKESCCFDFINYCKGKIRSNSKIRKTLLVSFNFDCFCCTLYYFDDANRFFDG